MNGLYLKSSAVALLEKELLGREADLNQNQVIRAVTAVVADIQAQTLASNLVDEGIMDKTLTKWRNDSTVVDSDLSMDKVLQVVDTFAIPRMEFRRDRSQFFPTTEAQALHASNAQTKADIFRYRLSLLRQRTMRNPLFQKPVAGTTVEQEQHVLTPISALLGTDDAD